MRLIKTYSIKIIQKINRLLRRIISGSQNPDISSRTAYAISIGVIMFSIISFFFYPKAGAVTFTTSSTWTVPSGTTGAILEAWGGGGAGAGSGTNGTGGGGGAGGQYAKKTLSVTVGQVYTVTVGTTTSGGTSSGSAGKDSQVTDPSSTVVVLAKGGAGGTAGGAGGTGSTTSGVGDTVFAGGSGAAGSSSSATAGAGGGGAGSTGAGGSASGTTPGTGTTTNGGNGGNVGSNAAGGAGSNYGGGGGGAAKTSGGGKSGGTGAQGLVIITPITNSSPSTPTLSAPASSATSVSSAPQFQLSSTDANSDYIEYRIYLYQSDCTTAISGSPFTETASQIGWSGQNANSNTAYSSGSTATYTYQGNLSSNTTYCWKADAIDPGGSNTYSNASSTQTFTTGISIRHELNILDSNLPVNSTSNEIVHLDATQYSGKVSFYFEIVTSSSSASTDNVNLYLASNATNASTITLAGTAANVRVRSSAFSSNFSNDYVVKTGASHSIKSAKIIVNQVYSSSLTSSESQIEIGNNETAFCNASALPLSKPKYWTYTAANWDGNNSFYVEATKSQSGTTGGQTTTIALQQDDGSFGTWTTVASASDGSTTSAIRIRSSSFTPTDGRHYRLVTSSSSCSGGKNYSIYNAKVVIEQRTTWTQSDSTTLTGTNIPDSVDSLSSTQIVTLQHSGTGYYIDTYSYSSSAWSHTGSTLTLSSAVTCGNLSALSSTNAAAVCDGGLTTYSFNGSSWSQLGNTLSINTSGNYKTAALSTTSVAVYNNSNNTLTTYSFDGTNWSQVGSSLSVGSLSSIEDLTSTQIAACGASPYTSLQAYSFNGSTWSTTGNAATVTNCLLMTALTTSRVAVAYNLAPSYLTAYDFDGTNWTQYGNSQLIATYIYQDIAALSSSTIVSVGNYSTTTFDDYSLNTSPTQITKLEDQYLLMNTGASSTGLQGAPSLWDASEWSGTTSSYKNVIDSTNASGSAKLTDIDNANTDVTNSTVTGNNQVFSSAMTMPTSGHQIDTNITASATTVTADRIIVTTCLSSCTNSPPNAPTLSTPSSGATGISTTPSFTLSATDPNGDAIKYRLYLYQSDCTTAVGTSPFAQATSGTGWDNGTTAYTSGATATYTYQGTLTAGTTYCWKADAIDPSGSNTYGSASATQSFTTAAAGPTTDQLMRGGTYFSSGSKQPIYWAQ